MAIFCDIAFTRDADKNKTSETITGVMSGYGFTSGGTTYDFEDRLTGYPRQRNVQPVLDLTSVGDWTSVTTNGIAQNRTHGPTHELLTAGGSSVVTDVKGNMTSIPATLRPAGATTALLLSWDFDNKLASADIDANGTADVSFQYDALGRRVARTGTGGSFVFVQMDQQTIADYPVGGAASTPTYRYVYASYIDEPVVRKTAGTGGTLVYFHRNQQYSVTAITTSTGSIAERYAYSAYGQPTILDASGLPLTPQSSTLYNRYTYTGREWDATLGLHHFRARWMSPVAGRFLGRDPIGYLAGANQYRFVRNRVFRHLDPMGYDIECYPAGTFYIDPDTYNPDYLPRHDWQLRFWLNRHLGATCSGCNYCNSINQIPSGCDESSCRRQANAIANAVGDTLENNGNWNPLCRLPFGVNYGCFTGDGYPIEWNQRFRGYFCWDWARAFYRAIQSVNASCFDIDLEFAGFPDTTGRMHVWVKITSKCTGGSFYVDDGFGTGTYGNFDTPCGHYPYVGTCSPSSLPDSWHRPTPYGPDMNPLK